MLTPWGGTHSTQVISTSSGTPAAIQGLRRPQAERVRSDRLPTQMSTNASMPRTMKKMPPTAAMLTPASMAYSGGM